MAVTVTVKGLTFTIPERQERGWGDQVTSWIQEVSSAVNDITSVGDIPLTSVSVVNTGVLTTIDNLSFNTSLVRHAEIRYGVYRVSTGAGATELSQKGTIFITYKSTSNTWEIEDHAVGDARIQFSITNAGQLQYTATAITGTYNLSGSKLSFRAEAFPI